MAMSEDEGKALLKLFEDMGVKPKCANKTELQEWMAEMVKGQTQSLPDSKDTKLIDKVLQSTTIQQSFKLSALFSGLQPGKGECTFDLWKYEVDCLIRENVYSEENQRRMIRASLRGEAAHVLKRLGPDASVANILQKMFMV